MLVMLFAHCCKKLFIHILLHCLFYICLKRLQIKIELLQDTLCNCIMIYFLFNNLHCWFLACFFMRFFQLIVNLTEMLIILFCGLLYCFLDFSNLLFLLLD